MSFKVLIINHSSSSAKIRTFWVTDNNTFVYAGNSKINHRYTPNVIINSYGECVNIFDTLLKASPHHRPVSQDQMVFFVVFSLLPLLLSFFSYRVFHTQNIMISISSMHVFIYDTTGKCQKYPGQISCPRAPVWWGRA